MSALNNDNVLDNLQSAGNLCKQELYDEALNELFRLWNLVPDPKPSMPNAYLIVLYGVSLALKRGNYERALEWATRGLEFSGNRNLGGESEFLMGEVYYETGDTEKARTYFKMVRENSGFRLFRGKNPSFRALIDFP